VRQSVSKGTFHRELAELRRKIKTAQDEAGEFDEQIVQMKRQQQDVAMLLDERQVTKIALSMPFLRARASIASYSSY